MSPVVGKVNLGRNEIPKTSSTILLRPARHTDPEFFCCEVCGFGVGVGGEVDGVVAE